MISRSGKENFIAAHYDWIVAAVGALALVGAAAFFVTKLGLDPDAAAVDAAAEVDRLKPAETGVKEPDFTEFGIAMRVAKKPTMVDDVPADKDSFLASERRVKCINPDCAKAIPGGLEVCPFCQKKQETEKQVAFDGDGDGMPDKWEKLNKLNPADASDANADNDGDGFTNLEEYQAKTDPNDRNSHPDYLDSLKVVLPLNETYLPFALRKANKIPSGWRLEFFDPKLKDEYGRVGATVTALVGEPIGSYGYKLVKYEPKTVMREIKGSSLKKPVDVSEAVVERESDHKQVTLVVQTGGTKNLKFAPIDIQATLSYERNGAVTFKVVPGETIDLSGAKFKVTDIKAVGKGAKVTFEEVAKGRKRTLDALE